LAVEAEAAAAPTARELLGALDTALFAVEAPFSGLDMAAARDWPAPPRLACVL